MNTEREAVVATKRVGGGVVELEITEERRRITVALTLDGLGAVMTGGRAVGCRVREWTMIPAAEVPPSPRERLLGVPILEFLGVEAGGKRLRAYGEIETVADLLRLTHADLVAIRNIGEGTVQKIAVKLMGHGLSLADGWPGEPEPRKK